MVDRFRLSIASEEKEQDEVLTEWLPVQTVQCNKDQYNSEVSSLHLQMPDGWSDSNPHVYILWKIVQESTIKIKKICK